MGSIGGVMHALEKRPLIYLRGKRKKDSNYIRMVQNW